MPAIDWKTYHEVTIEERRQMEQKLWYLLAAKTTVQLIAGPRDEAHVILVLDGKKQSGVRGEMMVSALYALERYNLPATANRYNHENHVEIEWLHVESYTGDECARVQLVTSQGEVL